MVISGHNTLSEVDRYTKDVDRRRLATSGMAKRVGQSMKYGSGKPGCPEWQTDGQFIEIKRLRFF